MRGTLCLPMLHRSLLLLVAGSLPAQHAFLDKWSAFPGETVTVYASVDGQTSVGVRRSHYFGQSTLLTVSGVMPSSIQPVVTGSHAFVDDHPLLDITGDISLEAWIRPKVVRPSDWAGILLKYRNPGETAYGIYLMPGGEVSFYLGATGVFNTANRLLSTNQVAANAWTHIVATYDGSEKRLYIDGQLDVTQPRTGPIFASSMPLQVGAFNVAAVPGGVDSFYDGDIDGAAVYDRALTPAEVQARFAAAGADPTILPGTVARWDFEEMDGTTFTDATGNGLDLTLVNYGTRGIPGPSEPACCSIPTQVPTFPSPCCPKPTNWCIRFASDDSYNPSWTPTWSFVVPPTWDPGFYRVEVSGAYVMPFIVKPPPGQRAAIAVLANSNTWTAYNNWSNSLYDTHPGNWINRYVGMLQPHPNARLDLQLPGNGGFSPRVDAERYLYKWLDDNHYEFDIYTDLDLHKDPTLLSGYRALIIQGHSEYWTWEAMNHVEAFLVGGGNLVNLSGNTMWSRVTYSPDFTVMEGRKHPWGGFASIFPPGERWHSQDGQVVGGTFRCIGRPEHAILGTGYGVLLNNGSFGAYSVENQNHWVFAGTGVQHGDFFGTSSLNGNAILGHEIDEIHPQWSPANIELLARGANFVSNYRLDVSNCNVRQFPPATEGGDMIYYDHPGGGGVFGAPTVAFGGSVMLDAVASQVLRNVLDRFLAGCRGKDTVFLRRTISHGQVGSTGHVLRFDACGELDPSGNVEAWLRHAPPHAPALFFGAVPPAEPVEYPWGTIVAAPAVALPFVTDREGRVRTEIPGNLGVPALLAQWAVLDAGSSGGIGLSNALRIEWP